MLPFAAGVNEYQTVFPMLPQGEGSPTWDVAGSVLRLVRNGREAIGEALAKLSFGGDGASLTFAMKASIPPLKVRSRPGTDPNPSPSGKVVWVDSVSPTTYAFPAPSTSIQKAA